MLLGDLRLLEVWMFVLFICASTERLELLPKIPNIKPKVAITATIRTDISFILNDIQKS